MAGLITAGGNVNKILILDLDTVVRSVDGRRQHYIGISRHNAVAVNRRLISPRI